MIKNNYLTTDNLMRDVVIYQHPNGSSNFYRTHRVSYLSEKMDLLCYPLLFLRGELGWTDGIKPTYTTTGMQSELHEREDNDPFINERDANRNNVETPMENVDRIVNEAVNEDRKNRQLINFESIELTQISTDFLMVWISCFEN